jgi:heme exporter protein A
MTTTATAIRAEGLCRRYGRRWALIRLDLSLEAGESLLVVGRNGAGKSTLLRLLGTALSPDQGSLSIAGFDVREQRREARQKVALLGHHSYLFEDLTAAENLRLVAQMTGHPAHRAAIDQLLTEVGLAERRDDPVSTFSAGMRKRLAIGRLLLQRPAVALFDEPYGQLDPAGFAWLEGVFERLAAGGTTLVIATHLVARGAAVCERALLLEAGRSVWSGRADEMPDGAGLEPHR